MDTVTAMRLRPLTIGRTSRRGFSFTEVLFAVMVLAIGFIMVAAMFPVTIRQQQMTLEETVGASTARMAIAYVQNNDLIKNLRKAGNRWENCEVFSATENRSGTVNQGVWESLAGNFILPENPRVAWVPLFRRPGNESGVAQVYMFVVQNRNRPTFETVNVNVNDPTVAKNAELQGKDIFRVAGNINDPNNPNYATLEPKPVWVRTTNANNETDVDTIEFVRERSSGEVDYREAAAEGGYVIIAEADGDQAVFNGRVYRLGERVDDPAKMIFELIPGSDLAHENEELTDNRGTKAFIIGKALRDPTRPWDAAANPFEGPTQDVAVYTGFVRLPPAQQIDLP